MRNWFIHLPILCNQSRDRNGITRTACIFLNALFMCLGGAALLTHVGPAVAVAQEIPETDFQIMLPLVPGNTDQNNRAPIAVADSYQTLEDRPLSVPAAEGLLVNDSDPDGNPILTSIVRETQNGSVLLRPDGSFDYVPSPNYFGEDQFMYISWDGLAPSDITTVTLTVLPENDAPIARNDAYETREDTTLTVNAPAGVLANDSDPDSPHIFAGQVESASNGELNLRPDGSFVYVPAANFAGAERFTYISSDGRAVSDQAVVTVNVSPQNDSPIALIEEYSAAEDTTTNTSKEDGVLANDRDVDGDELRADLVSDVAHGTLTLNANGSFTYRPAANYFGPDSFSYVSHDGVLQSNVATVTLTIAPVNDVPIAAADTYTTPRNTPLAVAVSDGVLANDRDIEATSLVATLDDDVSNGTLILEPDGAFSYVPNPNFSGRDEFTYRAGDGETLSTPVVVTLDVGRGNQPPRIAVGEFVFDKEVIAENVDETHAVVAADLDNDGDIDVAATDYIDGIFFWYENDGSGKFTERVVDNNLAGVYPAHVADVDLDGDADLLAGGYLADTYAWYRNDGGGTLVRQDIDTASDGAHSIVTVDLDQDGDIDFVTASQDANQIAWYENDGDLNFTLRIIDDEALAAKRADAADIDGDGDLDVIGASFEDDEIAWYENDGNENFTWRIVSGSADGAYFVTATDVDGDGDIDLLSASQNDNKIAWYDNDGTGEFTTRVMDETALGARTVIAADVDDDGDMDALTAARPAHTVAWYKNDGNGIFTKVVLDNNATGAYSVFAVDMDFDGDQDILSAARTAGEVAVYTQYRALEMTVAKGATLAIDATLLRAEDADDEPAAIRYTLTTAPERGDLQRNGVSIGQGESFTQADINQDRLTYVHGGASAQNDGFVFTVTDDGDGRVPAEGRVEIIVTN